MEIRQLRYLLSAIRHGSLKAAAREHFVTQPAVSVQLKKLEEELGEKLYVRFGRGIRPTQAGEVLLAETEEILKRVDSLKPRIQAIKGLQTGFLKIGNIDAASVYVLPSVFRVFRRKYPGVDIRVLVSDSDTLITALDSGAIELAIATLPLPGESHEVVPIYEDRMVLVANPRHELVQGAPRQNLLQRVAEMGLITYPAKSTTRRLIEKVFIDNGLGLRVEMEMSSPEAIKKLTEAGLGASILPEMIVANELRAGTLKMIPTGKNRFSRMLGVVYKNENLLSPPAMAFLKMLIEKYQ